MVRLRNNSEPPKTTALMEYWDGLRSDYNATKQTRFKRVQRGLPLAGAGADYHYRSESQYLQLVEMVRDFERNDPVIRSAFNRLTSNVVRNGFTLDVTTGDDETTKQLRDKWLAWSEEPSACDRAGELRFCDMEKLAFRSMTRDGDICAVTLESGHLRWYEAHRLRTPRNTQRNVVLGIMLDENRQRQQYWFTRDEIDPWVMVDRVSDMTQINTRDAQGNRQVLHLYYPDRFSQTRGISPCVPCVDAVGMSDDIQFAKMVQQKMVSCYTIFRKRSPQWKPNAAGGDGAATSTDYAGGIRRVLDEVYPGMELFGDPGEELQGFSPNVPNPEFFQHAMMILGFIAAALDLPLMVLLLDPTRTNFSGWRGAIDQARLRFQDFQEWMIGVFHREVYRWKVRQWLKTEPWLQAAFNKGIDVFSHQWHAPSWDYIEPNKDVTADVTSAVGGMNSRRRLLAKRGLEIRDIDREQVEDNASRAKIAIKAALKLNDKFGEQLKKYSLPFVDWHELANAGLPPGYTMRITGQDQSIDEAPADGGDDSAPAKGTKKEAALA